MTLKALKTPIKHSPKTFIHSSSPIKTPIRPWDQQKSFTSQETIFTNLDRERLVWNVFILLVTLVLFITKGHAMLTRIFLINALAPYIYSLIMLISTTNLIAILIKISMISHPVILEIPENKEKKIQTEIPKEIRPTTTPTFVSTPVRLDISKTPLTTSPYSRRAYEDSIKTTDDLKMMLKSSPIGSGLMRKNDLDLLPSTPLMNKFQPALKPIVSPVIVERLEDGFLFKNVQATMDEWKVEPFLDNWTEEARKWLVNVIIRLSDRIKKSDETFKKVDLSHLDCVSATFSDFPNRFFDTTSTGNSSMGLNQSKPQTLLELSQKCPNEPAVIERLKLERHLTFHDYHCRAYIVNRINVLADRYSLSNYRWNDGQAFNQRAWNADEFPSDAQILMTLFIHYMDEQMGTYDAHKSNTASFSQLYFVPFGVKPDIFAKRIQIRQSSKFHYQLIVDKVIYDVYPGRNNVFYVISLFVYQIQNKAGGYVGLLDIGGKSIDLLSIINQ